MITYHLDHFEDYTIENFSSEDADFPASNLKLWTRREVPWKTTVTTESNVVLNFGSAKAINSVVGIKLNYTTIKIQGNATDTWGSPDFDSGNITIGQETYTNLYRLIQDATDLSGFNYQYLRWLIPSQTPTDGASAFSTGLLIVSTQATNYAIGPGSIEITPQKSDSQIEMWSGAIETINHGERFCEFNYNFVADRTGANHDSFNDLLVDTDRTKPIVLGFDSTLKEKSASTAYVFVCKRIEHLAISLDPVLMGLNSVRLREAV